MFPQGSMRGMSIVIDHVSTEDVDRGYKMFGGWIRIAADVNSSGDESREIRGDKILDNPAHSSQTA
jgi:hypothetical protein